MFTSTESKTRLRVTIGSGGFERTGHGSTWFDRRERSRHSRTSDDHLCWQF